MSKAETRLGNILEVLKENGSISLKDLMIKFDVTERTIKSDIAKLRERGLKIWLKNGVYISDVNKDVSRINRISKKDIRKNIVLQTITENLGLYKRKEIVEKVLKKLISEDSISYKTIERTIKELENNNLICRDSNDRYSLAMKTEGVYYINKNNANNFMYYVELYGDEFPSNNLLKSVSKKITSSMGTLEKEDGSNSINELNNIINLLSNDANGYSIKELSERLKVSVKVIKEDFKILIYNDEFDINLFSECEIDDEDYELNEDAKWHVVSKAGDNIRVALTPLEIMNFNLFMSDYCFSKRIDCKI